MLSFTSAELNGWITVFFYPLARILGVLAASPPFNNAVIPMRVRLALGLAIALTLAPSVPRINIDPGTGPGLWLLAIQMLIGLGMGFVMRLVFSAVDMAGNLISMQMGLGFAASFDPQNAGQTGVLSEFLGLLALMVFFAINGHLMLLATLAQSFSTIPIGLALPGSGTWINIVNAGSVIFSSGVLLSLPIIVALLITNVALGVLSRAAPQLSLFAIGFPLTLLLGFGMLIFSLSYLGPPLQQLFEYGLQAMLGHFVPPGG